MKKLLKIGGIILVAILVILIIAPSGKDYEKETSTNTNEKSSEITNEEDSKDKIENVKDEPVSEEPEEEKITVVEPEKPSYEIIPYETYESNQGEELMLYANLTWNDDYSVDIHGFGYENGEFSDRLITEEHLIPVPDTESSYQSEDGSVDMIFTDDFISIMSDSISDADVSFTGDFYLVMDESDMIISDDIMELSFEGTADFFRDKNNIGKTFRCRFFYFGRDTFETMGVDYHKFSFRYDNGSNTIRFLVYADAKETDPIFYDGEDIIVTGIYLGDKEGTGYSGFNVELISMELYKEE